MSEEISKKAKAAMLLRMIESNNYPEDRTNFICRLFTEGEIDALLVRDTVRKKILHNLRCKNPFSFKSIAEECGASAAIARKIWQAMLYEYPRNQALPDNNYKIYITVPPNVTFFALPKEQRAYDIVEEMLLAARLVIQIRDKSKAIIDLDKLLPPIPFQRLRACDIITHMRNGTINYAIIGNDKKDEYFDEIRMRDHPYDDCPDMPINVWQDFKSTFNMRLAVPKNSGRNNSDLTFLNEAKIATSYPNTLKKFLTSINIKDAIITRLDGGVEEALNKLGAVAIFDIVQSGKTLRENNLAPIVTVKEGMMQLISRFDSWSDSPDSNIIIRHLRSRLSKSCETFAIG